MIFMIKVIEGIPDPFLFILLLLGTVTFAVATAGWCILVTTAIKELVIKTKYRYERKHRFDKPPLARCYCLDCEYWHKHMDETEGSCWAHGGWTTADNWFCWEANPKELVQKMGKRP